MLRTYLPGIVLTLVFLAMMLWVVRNTLAAASSFRPDLPAGARCTVDVMEVHPTQFAVGVQEIAVRVERLRSMRSKEIRRYLATHVAPIVVGPEGRPYLLDRHHLACSLHASGVHHLMYAEVRDNWSSLPVPEFWARMQANGWAYRYDETGTGPLDPQTLPAAIDLLRDDPYRSLAWFVRNRGGYVKTDKAGAEFYWADFFRSRITLDPADTDMSRAIAGALTWVHRPEASGLPGYVPAPSGGGQP